MVSIEEIKKLREETGSSIQTSKHALEICNNYEVAKEFIQLRSQAIARYKIIDNKKIPFKENDYIDMAKNNVKNQYK